MGNIANVGLGNYASVDIETPADERDKPPCCDEQGTPPVDAEAAEAIADAVETRARRARRRR